MHVSVQSLWSHPVVMDHLPPYDAVDVTHGHIKNVLVLIIPQYLLHIQWCKARYPRLQAEFKASHWWVRGLPSVFWDGGNNP